MQVFNESEYWAGVELFEAYEECPADATHWFQKGYGEAYAAAEAKPPIDLREVHAQFNRVFLESA